MANGDGGRSLLGKILFVVGVIIILIILAFLIIKFVPRVISGLANVGSPFGNLFGSNDIELVADTASVENGGKVTLTWDADTSRPGSYGITYACTDNVEVDIVSETGAKSLICGTIFTLGPAANTATARVYLKTENSFADVPLQVFFTESGDTAPSKSGQLVVTVQDGNPSATTGTLSGDAATIDSEPVADTTTTKSTATGGTNTVYVNTPSRTTTNTSQQYVSYATGPADLAVTNIVASNTQVGFTVSNIGGRSTGTWVFSYTTPTEPKETFTSPLQMSLAPGQSIRYTLTFGAKAAGNQNVAVLADATNSVTEASETNNIATVTMSGSAYGNTGSSSNNDYDEDDDADFIIEDLEVGRVSGNRFIEDDTADEGDDIAVRFIVRNRGGEETEDWRFEITELPYSGDDSFRSREYDALRPGESIEIIVELDNIDEGDYDIEVEVDSEDDTDEERENNNKRSVDLEVEN